MKGRWLKILLKILGGLIVLLVLVFYFGTTPIDTTPYFETQYYRNTIQNINEAVKNKTAVHGTLFAGFAKTNITPQTTNGVTNPDQDLFTNIKLAGYGDGKIATGTHDSIYAKAIALSINDESVVLVSAELVAIPEEIVLDVEKRLKGKISRKQLYFGATHTHASIGNCVPGYVGKSFGGE